MVNSGTLNYFIIHAYYHGNEEDKVFAKYILKQYAKGILIINGVFFLYAATRFRNYRNSNLLACN